MSEEFNLSDKIHPYGFLFESDVKEFIRRLKDTLQSAMDMEIITKQQIIAFDYVLKSIDKLAGEKLK